MNGEHHSHGLRLLVVIFLFPFLACLVWAIGSPVVYWTVTLFRFVARISSIPVRVDSGAIVVVGLFLVSVIGFIVWLNQGKRR